MKLNSQIDRSRIGQAGTVRDGVGKAELPFEGIGWWSVGQRATAVGYGDGTRTCWWLCHGGDGKYRLDPHQSR